MCRKRHNGCLALARRSWGNQGEKSIELKPSGKPTESNCINNVFTFPFVLLGQAKVCVCVCVCVEDYQVQLFWLCWLFRFSFGNSTGKELSWETWLWEFLGLCETGQLLEHRGWQGCWGTRKVRMQEPGCASLSPHLAHNTTEQIGGSFRKLVKNMRKCFHCQLHVQLTQKHWLNEGRQPGKRLLFQPPPPLLMSPLSWPFLVMGFNRLIQFYRAVLDPLQNWKKGTEISHIRPAPTHT